MLMAYTRISAHDVSRVCEKYEKMFNSIVTQKQQSMKDKLMNRFLFPLTEINANKRVKLEKESIELNVAHDVGFDHQIYESLKDVCSVTRGADFITIDSCEAEFINRLRK